MYRLTSHFIAQIIQVVETAAYRRMLVRIQPERLSFVGEMIYLTVELNFHKTIIYYYYIKVKSRLVGLKSIKSYVKVDRSNTRNIRQVYRKGRLLTEQTLNQFWQWVRSEQRQATRKGSDVRSATTAKAAPQVIVGCGYLTDENLMAVVDLS